MDNEKGILWSAVIAGGIISLIMAALFNLLGLGSGLIAMDPSLEAMQTVGMATIFWFVISGIVSMFLGGWVSSKTAEVVCSLKASIYGLLSAAIAILFMLMMMATTLGAAVSGVASILSSSINVVAQNSDVLAKGMGNTAKDLLPQTDKLLATVLSKAEESVEQLKEGSKISPDAAKKQLKAALQDFLLNENDADNQSNREKLEEFLQKNTDMNAMQAEKVVNRWLQQYDRLKANMEKKAKEVTEKATNTLGTIALLSFFVVLLGLVAGAVGGLLGKKTDNRTNLGLNR